MVISSFGNLRNLKSSSIVLITSLELAHFACLPDPYCILTWKPIASRKLGSSVGGPPFRYVHISIGGVFPLYATQNRDGAQRQGDLCPFAEKKAEGSGSGLVEVSRKKGKAEGRTSF